MPVPPPAHVSVEIAADSRSVFSTKARNMSANPSSVVQEDGGCGSLPQESSMGPPIPLG